jgi:septum formation protein
LLRLLGIPFEVVVPVVEEVDDGDPVDLVSGNARLKARGGAEIVGSGAIVVGTDTDVVLDDRVLGKPADASAAREHLHSLSGRSHRVLSGVCVVFGDRVEEGVEATTVSFRDLGEDEIERYARSGEWEDRAGGYAVQGLGSSLVSRIDGDLSNVIGLPVPLLSTLLGRLEGG